LKGWEEKGDRKLLHGGIKGVEKNGGLKQHVTQLAMSHSLWSSN